MEKADFRDNLKCITEKFNIHLIPIKDAAEYLGCTVKQLNLAKDFPKKKVGGRYYVTAVALARWLS